MTAHYTRVNTSNGTATVQLGWDAPLQGFYMVVWQEKSSSDAYLYSNLADPKLASSMGMASSPDYFKPVLASIGLTIPDVMFAQADRDARTGVRVREVWYTADGAICDKHPVSN